MSAFQTKIDASPTRLINIMWEISEATRQKFGDSSSTVYGFLSVIKRDAPEALCDDHYLFGSDLLEKIHCLQTTELEPFIIELMAVTKKGLDFWGHRSLLELIKSGIIVAKIVDKSESWMQDADVFLMEKALKDKNWGT